MKAHVVPWSVNSQTEVFSAGLEKSRFSYKKVFIIIIIIITISSLSPFI